MHAREPALNVNNHVRISLSCSGLLSIHLGSEALAIFAKDFLVAVEDPRIDADRGSSGYEGIVELDSLVWDVAFEDQTRAWVNSQSLENGRVAD